MKRIWKFLKDKSGLILPAIVVSTLILLLFYFDDPVRRLTGGVKPGVELQGYRVEGMFRAEVAKIANKLARVEKRAPVDAVVDENRRTIIPEFYGIEVDEEATVELVMNAEQGSFLRPVYRYIIPSIRWEHYPALPARRGNPRKPAVSLVFHVSGGEEYIPEILKLLHKEKAGATFFLTGKWAQSNSDLVMQIYAGGNELGNHGYDKTVDLTELGSWEAVESIRQTSEIIFEIAGRYPVHYSPPGGRVNELILEAVCRQGLRTTLWSLEIGEPDNGIFAVKGEDTGNDTFTGQIILIPLNENTFEILAQVLGELKERNLKTLTLESLLHPGWPGLTRFGSGN